MNICIVLFHILPYKDSGQEKKKEKDRPQAGHPYYSALVTGQMHNAHALKDTETERETLNYAGSGGLYRTCWGRIVETKRQEAV